MSPLLMSLEPVANTVLVKVNMDDNILLPASTLDLWDVSVV
jgi:hypothetical protein